MKTMGLLPLEFTDASDCERIEQGDELTLVNLREQLRGGGEIEVANTTRGERYQARHHLSDRQVAAVLAGGQIPLIKTKVAGSG